MERVDDRARADVRKLARNAIQQIVVFLEVFHDVAVDESAAKGCRRHHCRHDSSEICKARAMVRSPHEDNAGRSGIDRAEPGMYLGLDQSLTMVRTALSMYAGHGTLPV